MPLININADFSKVASALERIAEALERLSPKPVPPDNEYLDLKDMSNVVPFDAPVPYDEQKEWVRYAPRNNYD